MIKQKDIFKSTEGNQWYTRNKKAYTEKKNKSDIIVDILRDIEITPKKVLEIGSANGSRLNKITNVFNCKGFGIDPSEKAIKEGKKIFPNLNLLVATVDDIPFDDNYFDLIIFGFYLYLCDRDDLFKKAYEADRCLCNEGVLIIKAFYPPFPYKNNYIYCKNVFSYKMDYSKMFKWNPLYHEIYKVVFTHSGYPLREIPNERIFVTILRKNEKYAYPLETFG